MRRRGGHSGLTLLELMVVIAIVGLGLLAMRSGFRALTKADLVENATELATLMKRTSGLAVEHGEMHRIVFDLDKGLYSVEMCQGSTAMLRNAAVRDDVEKTKDAIERGKQRMQQMPEDALAVGDADEAMKRATAIAGHHINDRTCVPAQDKISGDSKGREWIRSLRVDRDLKFKEIWVAHKNDSTTKGQVEIYFFPNGSAEKAVVEVTDGSDVFSILVYGLSGAVELRDGKLRDVDEHMMRNAMGDHDAKREDQ